jgi:hypothetical protein
MYLVILPTNKMAAFTVNRTLEVNTKEYFQIFFVQCLYKAGEQYRILAASTSFLLFIPYKIVC